MKKILFLLYFLRTFAFIPTFHRSLHAKSNHIFLQPSEDEFSTELDDFYQEYNTLENNQQNAIDRTFGIIYSIKTNDTAYSKYVERLAKLEQNTEVKRDLKSQNFRVENDENFNFSNVGGCLQIKTELMQCADMLTNFSKYEDFNVRTPKGLLLEGPPGNGKTILARAFSGQIKVSFIQASGADFQEKYVGVGASRIRELFELAKKAAPCIIFIDEVDAIGRKRGNSNENADAERDNTLNQLLTEMDGFKQAKGVFVICATNRADLLDSAFLRPGRIDKKLYIGNPDYTTREKILDIHLTGKPYDNSIDKEKLVSTTNGMSGAEIENLLNEAMLLAIRNDKTHMSINDIEYIFGRNVGGWQESENIFSENMIWRIAIHELGHGLISMALPAHTFLTSINLNLHSPKTPGYTIFEREEIDLNLHTNERLFAQLVVLLSGRTAEDFLCNHSVTTGAAHDLQEAYRLAENMILQYGMGSQNIFAYASDQSKLKIDEQISDILMKAQLESRRLIDLYKNDILYLAPFLIQSRCLTRDFLNSYFDDKQNVKQFIHDYVKAS